MESIDNPYLDDFRSLQEQSTFRGEQWFGNRQRLVEEYSWAVPTEDVITYLAEFDDLVEVGAGSGYWAWCIDQAGGNVKALDKDVPTSSDDSWYEVRRHYVNRQETTFDGDAVLMVWPPHNDDMAASVASDEPNHICYVGEPRGGCTASDSFFDIVESRYGLVGQLELPSYAGVDDNFYHYVRNI
jgi:hypothetical protein